MKSFRAWLRAKDPGTAKTDGQFDFIRDTPSASDFPYDVTTEQRLVRYLERRGACADAVRAGVELLNEWKAQNK